MLRITIANTQNTVPVDRARLKEVAKAVLAGEGIQQARISLAFVDNATVHRINLQFLDHDEPTDVITFPLSGPGAATLEGELVIGAEVARDRATDHQGGVESELALYVIHGLLHLCGHDDHRARERRLMRDRERHYLASLGLPNIAELD